MPVLSIALLKNEILAGLPKEEQNRILRNLEFVSLRQRDIVCHADRPIRYVYFPENSVISLLTLTEEGSSVEVGLIGPEGMLGFHTILDVKNSPFTGVVLVPGGGMRMTADSFQTEFWRGGVFQRLVLRQVNHMLTQVSQEAACNRVHLLGNRLSRWLLMVHDRVKRDDFPLTHEFISNMLGTPRSQVSSAASLLRKTGLIRYGRGQVRILDRKALESAACDCYRIIKNECNGAA